MNAHTPGPWSLVRSVKSWQMPLQIEAEDGTCIVALEPHPLHDMEANARLIAAAPELLEALEETLRPGGMYDKSVVHSQGAMQDEMLALGRKIKDAIAKAKGEQP